ncbi:MAG: hypothetical protein NZ874_09005 [Fimbriimonadales bacterium]|nr:hypothetical protein [Fimbriimonadales bacterium]
MRNKLWLGLSLLLASPPLHAQNSVSCETAVSGEHVVFHNGAVYRFPYGTNTVFVVFHNGVAYRFPYGMNTVIIHKDDSRKVPVGGGYVIVHEEGEIDWSKGVLSATGVGLMPSDEPNRARAYLKARGYARLDALANLLMLVNRVQIDAQYTGADYIAQSEEIRATVNGFLRGAMITDERKIYIEGQEAVQVTVSIPMHGQRGLSQLLLKPRATPAPAAPEPSLPRLEITRPNRTLSDAPLSVEGNYTGLIVDARGLNLQPAMAPRLLKVDGTPLYGVGNYDVDRVVEQGLAAYHKDLEAARKDPRAGSNPLILRPIGVYRRAVATTDAVLSDADAAKLIEENKRTKFLDQLRVVFVVD